MYGKKPWNYKEKIITKSGSRKVKYYYVHFNNVLVREHILIMEKRLGRKLKSDEVVHHIDGNGLNNNINNLEVMTKREHQITHNCVERLRGGGY